MLPSTQIVFPIALTTTMGLKFLSTAGLQLCHILGLLTSEECKRATCFWSESVRPYGR